MNSNDLYNNLKELWEEFDSNHNVFADKGNKAAGTRALALSPTQSMV